MAKAFSSVEMLRPRLSTYNTLFNRNSFSGGACSNALHVNAIPTLKWFSTSVTAASPMSPMAVPSSLSPQFSNPHQLPPESLFETIYRWMDVTGYFTRWNNRKAWVMYLDASRRSGAIMITEFERKLKMFINLNEVIMFSLSVWIWYHLMEHFNAHAPPPKTTPDGVNAEHLSSHLNPFSRMPGIQPKNRCYECRWLDLECKRLCFDKLKAEGRKMRIYEDPLSKPRYVLERPHHSHGAH